jgi:hypothetical protein
MRRSGGGSHDDFPRSDFLAELIRGDGRDPYRWLAVDLGFNGDTFYLLTAAATSFPRSPVTRRLRHPRRRSIFRVHNAFCRNSRVGFGG